MSVAGCPDSRTGRMVLFALVSMVAVSVAVRFYRLDAPITDHMAWRQASDALMAKYYYEYSYSNFFSPKTVGDTPEPTPFMNEFPLYPYILSLLYLFTGYEPFWGRLVSILANLLGACWLYRLIRESGEGFSTASFASAMFLISPLMCYYGRAHQRHMLVLTLIIGTLLLFHRYLRMGNWKDYSLTAMVGSLTILLNAPAAYVGIPLIYLAATKHGKEIFGIGRFWLLATILLLPAAAWYAYALASGHTLSLLPLGREGFRDFTSLSYYFQWLSWDFFESILEHVTKYILTPFGTFLVILAFFGSKEKTLLPLFWTLGVFLYFCLDSWPIALGSIHDYYYLNIVPPFCWYAGRGWVYLLEKLKLRSEAAQKIILPLVLILLCGSFGYRIYRITEWFMPFGPTMEHVLTIDRLVPKKAILILDQIDDAISLEIDRPTYKASPINNEKIDIIRSISKPQHHPQYAYIGSLSEYGGSSSEAIQSLKQRYKVIFEDGDKLILDLR